jgi:DNA-binding NtrC family response regulator
MIEVNTPLDPSLSADLPAIVCDGKLTLEQIERQVIVATLVHNGGHRQRTARDLDIGVRTLGLKLKKWKEQKLVAETL